MKPIIRVVSDAAYVGGAMISSSLSAAPALAGTYSILHLFTGGADGAVPVSSVILDANGNLYGEASAGGNICLSEGFVGGRNGYWGCGTLYKIDPAGNFTTLTTFLGSSNGAIGDGNLTLAYGRLFGSTLQGGPHGDGVMFDTKTNGAGYTVLHDFSGPDGENPSQSPVITAGKVLYDTTVYGGTAGLGTLFKVMQDGTEIVLHSFTGGTADGQMPGRILIGADGTIFGGTGGGGTGNVGVAYSYVPSTGIFTVLHSFNAAKEGSDPKLSAISTAGVIYGATSGGGGNTQYGAVFALNSTPGGYTEHTLYRFTNGADGGTPQAGPALASGNVLIGTTQTGGTGGWGTLYSLSGSVLTTLHAFSQTGGAYWPLDTPTIAPDGTIYGTAESGGGTTDCILNGTDLVYDGCGVVFRYSP